MTALNRRAALILILGGLAGCGGGRREGAPMTGLNPGETPEMRALIVKHAVLYDVPDALIHRVVQRESDYNPAARNHIYYGLMQIQHETARTMGYRGSPRGLLDADTNLRYGVKYLRGAWLLSDGSFDTAIKWYSQGYYYEAKRRGMLEETGLR